MAEKRKVSQSIYDAMEKGVVANKGKWHTATSKGEDATVYAEAAKPSYKFLSDNGYQDIADALANMDYTQAHDYLNTFEVESEPLSYADQLNKMYESQANKSDKTFSTIETDKNTLFSDWNDYLADVRAGYTGTDYYNSIAQTYAELGDNAILGELAATGAENSGNIDSYAKAQAQRQQIAYKNAGEAAALDQYNAIMANLYGGITGKADTAKNAWSAMQSNVNSDQSLYSDMYGYLTSADADIKAAEQNALAAQYEAQTEANDSIYKIAEAATKAWAEGQSEYPTAEAYADYYNSVLNGLTPTAEAPTVDTTYTDEERKGVIDKFATVANDSSLPLEKRMQIISDYTLNAELADIIEHMTKAEYNQLAQIINNLQAQIDGQNTNGEIALS